MTNVLPAQGDLSAPPLARRLACFAYEGVLLFGVVMAVGLVYGVVTRQTHALHGLRGLQAALFVALGLYFAWFWSRGGQTLAMQTWEVRIVTASGQPLTAGRATARYLLSWMWFLPALTLVYAAGLKSSGAAFTAMATGVLAYAALARLHPQRQFWHDAACGTRLVHWPRPAKLKT